MQLQRSILPITDNAALTIFEELVKLVPGAQNPQGRVFLGDAGNQPVVIQCPLDELRGRDEIAAALNENGEVFSLLAVSRAVPQLGANVAVSLSRDAEGVTRVTLDLSPKLQASEPGTAAAFAIAFEKAFSPYSRRNVLRDVNPVIEMFYNRTNAETVRLMERNESIIR
jgi:hypothetical protein